MNRYGRMFRALPTTLTAALPLFLVQCTGAVNQGDFCSNVQKKFQTCTGEVQLGFEEFCLAVPDAFSPTILDASCSKVQDVVQHFSDQYQAQVGELRADWLSDLGNWAKDEVRNTPIFQLGRTIVRGTGGHNGCTGENKECVWPERCLPQLVEDSNDKDNDGDKKETVVGGWRCYVPQGVGGKSLPCDLGQDEDCEGPYVCGRHAEYPVGVGQCVIGASFYSGSSTRPPASPPSAPAPPPKICPSAPAGTAASCSKHTDCPSDQACVPHVLFWIQAGTTTTANKPTDVCDKYWRCEAPVTKAWDLAAPGDALCLVDLEYPTTPSTSPVRVTPLADPSNSGATPKVSNPNQPLANRGCDTKATNPSIANSMCFVDSTGRKDPKLANECYVVPTDGVAGNAKGDFSQLSCLRHKDYPAGIGTCRFPKGNVYDLRPEDGRTAYWKTGADRVVPPM